MQDGNESRVVLWVADTVIVKKPLDGGTWYFVADAKTGQPIAKANLEFFGYRQEHLGDNRWKVDTNQFAEFTDATGQLQLKDAERRNDFSYLITATTPDGRLAYHGFTHVWAGRPAKAGMSSSRKGSDAPLNEYWARRTGSTSKP